MEWLLKKRLEETGQYRSASGISAFISLVVRAFRYLKYKEIPEFLDCLLKTDSINLSTLVDNTKIAHSSPVLIAEVIQVSSV